MSKQSKQDRIVIAVLNIFLLTLAVVAVGFATGGNVWAIVATWAGLMFIGAGSSKRGQQ